MQTTIEAAPAIATTAHSRQRVTSSVLATLPYIAAVLVTAWVFRPLRQGRLPGNIGDARWSLAIHEHWYDVWRGDAPLRDTGFFFPLRGIVGTTEAFFFQGQVYSAARVLGIGMIDSWAIAQLLTYLVGVVGVAALARRLLRTTWAQVAAVVLCGASYPVLTHIGHVQLLFAFWPAWLILAAWNIASGRFVRSSFLALCLLPPVIALSSWYVLALAAFSAAVFVVLALLITPFDRWLAPIRRFAMALRASFGAATLVSVVLGLAAWCAVGWIFLSGRRLIAPPTWSEVAPLLPHWSDLVNAADDGSIWSSWTSATPQIGERAYGFGPLLLLTLVLVTISNVAVLVRSSRAGGHGPMTPIRLSVIAGLTALALPLLILTDDSGRSLFKPIWSFVPGMESIRAPYRIMFFVYALAIFTVLVTLERCATSVRETGRQMFAGLTVALILGGFLLEMSRTPEASWRAENLLPGSIRQWSDEVGRCDAIVLVDENPTDPGWVTPIDAVVLSALSGVPTPQGYGRAAPIGHPGLAATPEQLKAWMQERDFGGSVCEVSSAGVAVAR